MKVTLKELFINEFGLDVEAMEVGVPIDVSEACIGVKAFNEETGKDELAKVNFAIKKQLQSNLKIKLKGRRDFEQPVADKHLFAIIKHNDNKIDYTFASDLQVGMKLITDSGEDEIECIEKSEDAYVYDMETSFKNYYTNGILSHNSLMSHLPSQTGGKAIRFYASTRNRITKVDQIKSGTDPIGIKIRVRNYKNKTGQPWRDAEMELYFENGFNSDNEYLEFLVKFDIIHKAGGWFSAPDLGMPKLQGGVKVQEWLKENPTIYDELKKKVDQKLLVKNELDAENVDPVIAGVGDVDPETEEEATSPVVDLAAAALGVDTIVEDPPVLDI